MLKNLGPCPPPVPGKKWVLGWMLIDKTRASPSKSEKSFEKLALEKLKGSDKAKKPQKRKRIDFKTKVITQSEYLEGIKKAESKARGRKSNVKAIVAAVEDTDSDFYENESDVEEMCVKEMKDTWKQINPPEKESDIVGKWYAVIFTQKGKFTLYVGKAMKRFLCDENGPATSLEIDCLKPNFGKSNIFDSVPSHLQQDIGLFNIEDVFVGPLNVTPYCGNKWVVEDYDAIHDAYLKLVTLDRKKLYNKLFPKS